MIKETVDEILSGGPLLFWITGISLLMFISTLLLIPVLVIRIPEDYFQKEGCCNGNFRRKRPFFYWSVLLLKNLMGGLFILGGIVMLFLPGQGILSIFIGLSFSNFPGKRRLERKLVSPQKVQHVINRLRIRAGKPPLLPPF